MLFLLLKGYRILALRHRNRFGEVDIIARKGDLIDAGLRSRPAPRNGWAWMRYAMTAAPHPCRRVMPGYPDAAMPTGFPSLRHRVVLPGRWPQHFKDAF